MSDKRKVKEPWPLHGPSVLPTLTMNGDALDLIDHYNNT